MEEGGEERRTRGKMRERRREERGEEGGEERRTRGKMRERKREEARKV